ncbi:hypothetical protein [Xanthocytophaga flava]|uniref:hypothetical protein n=1 Tax=Xanthocytophaga flava TaxID=3048013 RepID=UPI0028D12802|nr:hypothetical protein [Xanthocytophaga flavus]
MISCNAKGCICALAIFLPRGKPTALCGGGSAESALFLVTIFGQAKKVTGGRERYVLDYKPNLEASKQRSIEEECKGYEQI